MKKMKTQANNIYKQLQKKKNAIKIRAFLMTGFLLAINTFAWFIFITKSNGIIDADVIAWDIAFLDDDAQVELIDLELNDLHPGMLEYTKSIKVKNQSDLDASFTYSIEELTIFGEAYEVDDIKEMLEHELPFVITFTNDKEDLKRGEILTFTIKANWAYEAENEYYKLNSIYDYVSYMNYYQFDEETSEYNLVEVTEENFKTLVEEGLYIESDEGDTYWGEQSIIFKKTYPDSSIITIKVKLIVTQKE